MQCEPVDPISLLCLIQKPVLLRKLFLSAINGEKQKYLMP